MKKKKYISRFNQKRKNKIAYLFLLPWLIGAVAFSLIPAIMTFLMSFMKVNLSTKGYEFEFNGLRNYSASLFENINVIPNLGQFLKIELLYVPVILVMSFILALLLVKNIKGKGLFRTIFFMPVIIISGTLISVIFPTQATEVVETVNPLTTSFIYRVLASYSYGFANLLVELFDNFVIIMWLTGIPIVLLINGLQKINKDMYEAANIDGANKWQILWKITIPNVLGVAFICAVFSIVQISILPLSDMFTMIKTALNSTVNNSIGIAATYSIIYVLMILLLIGLFKLILVPREKKEKEYMTITMKEQLDATLKKMDNTPIKEVKK